MKKVLKWIAISIGALFAVTIVLGLAGVLDEPVQRAAPTVVTPSPASPAIPATPVPTPSTKPVPTPSTKPVPTTPTPSPTESISLAEEQRREAVAICDRMFAIANAETFDSKAWDRGVEDVENNRWLADYYPDAADLAHRCGEVEIPGIVDLEG